MASSTVVANLINREVENSDAWSLGCDITIEEMDVVVEEIKLNDIAIAGVVKTDGISVDIDHDKNNVMDLDVNVVIDGLNSSIVESQVVPYERVVEINNLSPESSYEKGFAASAKSVKKVKDSVDSLDNTVKSNTSNISKVTTDIESLTRRVDKLSEGAGGEDLGGIWYIDELTGNLVTDKQVEIKSNLIVAGDTSTGGTGEDPGVAGGFLGVKVGTNEYKTVTPDGLLDMTDAFEDLDVDFSDYYTKTEVDNKIPSLEGYAKTEELDKYLLKKAESQEIEGDITIKGNLIITGDTSTGGTGQDTPSGIDEAQLKEYLDTNKYITSDYAYSKEEVNRLIDEVNAGDIDLTNYYTKEETTSEISKAITALNVGQYAKASDLSSLQGEVDNIESVLGMDEEAEGIINTWNEVKAFLDGYSSSDDLAAILSGMNADIATRALGSDLNALAARVGVNEAAIADNATNIRNAKGEIDGLKDTKANWGTTLAHYGITDAYTKTEVANELAKYLLLESANQTIKGNITIEGNLIVKGDTSSTARGADSGTDGTLIGVIVNGTRYEDETNGMLDLSSLMNQYALATEIPSLEGYAKLTDIPSLEAYALKTEIPTTMAWTAITGKPSFASVATSGSYNDLSNKPTIPTTLPASDVYAWAKAATKPSYKTSEVAEETNLYFTNARAVSALADTLKDYVTKTALASDLGEYASKEWVNEKGYITGITLTGDDYISVNGYRLSLAIDAQGGLENTGQGLGVGNLRHSLKFGSKSFDGGADKTITASDLGLGNVENKSSATIRGEITATNVTNALGYTPANNASLANYLPLSGGKLESNGTNLLILNSKSSSTQGVYLRMEHNSVKVGEFGCGWGLGIYMLNGSNYLAVKDDGYPYYNENIIIHSGNIGSQNVYRAERAEYLIHSDSTIGLKVLSGGVINPSNRIAFDTNTTGICRGSYYTSELSASDIVIAAPKMVFYEGNVLIDTTTNDGISGKLIVETGATIRGYAAANSITKVSDLGGKGLCISATQIRDAWGMVMWTEGSGNGFIQQQAFGAAGTTYALSLNPFGGNVGIGTTNPSYKLHVNGDIRGNVLYGTTLYAATGGDGIYLTGSGIYYHNSSNQWVRDLVAFASDGSSSFKGAVTMSSTLSVGGLLTANGNAVIKGDTSTGSDIRFKDKLSDHRIALSDIANAPLFTFTWNDREDDSVHLGSSAQYWENVAPWLVKGEDFKTLDYSTLGVAIGISLANKAVNHEERIKILEDKVKALEAENRRLRYGS